MNSAAKVIIIFLVCKETGIPGQILTSRARISMLSRNVTRTSNT